MSHQGLIQELVIVNTLLIPKYFFITSTSEDAPVLKLKYTSIKYLFDLFFEQLHFFISKFVTVTRHSCPLFAQYGNLDSKIPATHIIIYNPSQNIWDFFMF